MLHLYLDFSNSLTNFIGWIDNSLYFNFIYIQTTINYITSLFWVDIFSLKWSTNVLYHWFQPYKLDNLYNFLIADNVVVTWLTNSINIFYYFNWFTLNLTFQSESALYNAIMAQLIVKKINYICYLDAYYTLVLYKILKYSFISIIFLNFFFFTRYTLNISTWFNNVIFSKFFLFFETEEEVGSVDDSLMFIILFFLLFSWFFLVSFFFFHTYFLGFSLLSLGFFILVFFVMLIPFGVLLDFGLAFSSYIRGAGAGTNLVIEIIFDLIGTLVVFTRFIVQNIRFVLIFWAYFELFEWIYNSPYNLILTNMFTINSGGDVDISTLTIFTGYYYFILLLSYLCGYIYYFVHLIILLFIQLGAYFLISFWLFFFFYTSFYLTKSEKYFFFKKYF